MTGINTPGGTRPDTAHLSPAAQLGHSTTGHGVVVDFVRQQLNTAFDGESIRREHLTIPRELEWIPMDIDYRPSFTKGILFIPPHMAPSEEMAIRKSDILAHLSHAGVTLDDIHSVVRIQLENDSNGVRLGKITVQN